MTYANVWFCICTTQIVHSTDCNVAIQPSFALYIFAKVKLLRVMTLPGFGVFAQRMLLLEVRHGDQAVAQTALQDRLLPKVRVVDWYTVVNHLPQAQCREIIRLEFTPVRMSCPATHTFKMQHCGPHLLPWDLLFFLFCWVSAVKKCGP